MNKTIALLLCGLLGVFATIGITRMSFGMILPLLESHLALNMTKLGFISSTNFIGYFVGVLLANNLINTYKTTHLMIAVLLLEMVFMFSMTISSHYIIIALLYGMVGIFSAIGYLAIMGYVITNINAHYKGRALGVAISGNSLGIIVSGISVYVLALFNNYNWQDNWLLFAISIALCLLIISRLFNQNSKQHSATNISSASTIEIMQSKKFWQMAGVYFIFGAGYTIFLTFFVDFIITDFAISTTFATYFWFILGAVSLFSGPVFGSIADKTSVYTAFVIAYGFQAVASVLLVMIDVSWVVYLSAGLFGISVWAMPSLIFALSSESFSTTNATKAASLATIIFACGQIIGPISGGLLYDITLEYHNIFILTFIINLVASILSLIYARHKTDYVHKG